MPHIRLFAVATLLVLDSVSNGAGQMVEKVLIGLLIEPHMDVSGIYIAALWLCRDGGRNIEWCATVPVAWMSAR